jgi:opacity protein-like surface antigen
MKPCNRHAVFTLTLTLAALGAVGSTGAMAQGFNSTSSNRADTWEFFGEARVLFPTDATFEGGSKISTQSDAGFGLGFGYNVNEHINLGFEFSFNSVDYDGEIVPGAGNSQTQPWRVTGSMDTGRIGLTGTYNFLARPLTPYVTGTVGYAWVDTNIPDGPPQTGCWWDPWFGYICSTWQSTHSDSAFTGGVGAGLRWDVNRSFFLRLGYEHDWIDVAHATSTPGFDMMRIQFGSRY